MSTTLKQISPETLKLIEHQARALGLSADEYLRQLLPPNEQELALKADVTDDEFEKDMTAFAEGTEELSSSNGGYSREDIYLDHN
jgi:hypothetical protein